MRSSFNDVTKNRDLKKKRFAFKRYGYSFKFGKEIRPCLRKRVAKSNAILTGTPGPGAYGSINSKFRSTGFTYKDGTKENDYSTFTPGPGTHDH